MRPSLLLALLLGASGCVAPPLVMPELAHASVARDYETYAIHRVGLMPFVGDGLTDARSKELQLAFFSELSESTPFEIVLLDRRDLEEIEVSEPYRRGWYRPRTIIGLSQHHNLDAILFGTLTQERFFPPQSLGVQIDMVAAETGLVIWSSSLRLDATDPRVAEGLKLFYGEDPRREDEGASWRIALLSPERFARFAAFQIASLL